MKRMLSTFLSVVLFSSSVYANEPSKWAENYVEKAKEIGIVTKSDYDYQANITRENLCNMIMATIKTIYKGNIESLYKYDNIQFDDTTSTDIINLAKMGIVVGVTDNEFMPNETITREEASLILYNTLNTATDVLKDYDEASDIYLPHNFKDSWQIHSWARNAVYSMYHLGIMFGTEDNCYSPLNNYTIEQAICHLTNIYNIVNNSDDIGVPDRQLYPDKLVASMLDSNNVLNATYFWDDDSKKYEPKYYDGLGNEYNNSEVGYVYPVENNYMVVQTMEGADVNSYTVIDKKGNEIIKGCSYVKLFDKDKCLYIEDGSYVLKDLKTNEIIGTYTDFQYAGNGMYRYVIDGKEGFYNSEFQAIIPPQYNCTNSNFANDYTILQKADDTYILIDTTGKIYKEFELDNEKYSVDSIVGKNIVLSYKDKYYLYNVDSERIGKEYDYLSFDDNSNCLAMKTGRYYLLDTYGDVLFDALDQGYSQIDYFEKGRYYRVYGVDKSNYSKITPYILLDKSGKIIREDLNNFELYNDGYGVNAYKEDNNTIVTFDNYGNDISRITTDSDIINFRFVNGLILVNMTNTSQYYTPSGIDVLNNIK